MASFTNCLLLVLAINVVFMMVGIADIPYNGLYEMVTHPETMFQANTLIKLLMDNLLVTAGLILLSAGILGFKSDTTIFAGMSFIFLTFGEPLINFYKAIQETSGTELAMFMVIPILLLYFYTLIAWWRGRAT